MAEYKPEQPVVPTNLPWTGEARFVDGAITKGKRSTMRSAWLRGKRYTIEGALTLDGFWLTK